MVPVNEFQLRYLSKYNDSYITMHRERLQLVQPNQRREGSGDGATQSIVTQVQTAHHNVSCIMWLADVDTQLQGSELLNRICNRSTESIFVHPPAQFKSNLISA